MNSDQTTASAGFDDEPTGGFQSTESNTSPDPHPTEGGESAGGFRAGSVGILVAGVFYLGAYFIPWSPLQRYFLGHPVAIAATTLFWVAVSVLVFKYLHVLAQQSRIRTIRDQDLVPSEVVTNPTGRWLQDHDAGYVASRWLQTIAGLPSTIRSASLVQRLNEVLVRQTQRGTTKHLADDLRELSNRDADVAHDSLGLVRIIVWAIPMLGFLGTVIGITQTLGGLDFTDGTAAVDRLKAGLYVAFDTTALGLVLSVVAIFLQFPVERSEQRLMSEIDARVGHLVSAHLPSDEVSDNQTSLIADLCEGVQVAIAQSLASQAELWRSTIDDAQTHWQQVQAQGTNQFAEAIEQTLAPALADHSSSVAESCRTAGQGITDQATLFREAAAEAQAYWQQVQKQGTERFADAISSTLSPALRVHAESIAESATKTGERLAEHTEKWHHVLEDNANTLLDHQEELIEQCERLADTNARAESIQAIQVALDSNLERLSETRKAVADSVEASGANGMIDAMMSLARAVDTLNRRLADSQPRDNDVTASRTLSVDSKDSPAAANRRRAA